MGIVDAVLARFRSKCSFRASVSSGTSSRVFTAFQISSLALYAVAAVSVVGIVRRRWSRREMTQ
jgi:hypothetical protein